jgi:hypothetical protein
MIQKPIDLKVRDFKTDLINLINGYGLPLSIVSMIMQDTHKLVSDQLQETLNVQEKQYQIQLKAEQEAAEANEPSDVENVTAEVIEPENN